MEGTIKNGSKLDLTKFDSIKLNHLIAFRTPGSLVIKVLRVVGLPGDIIEIVNGDILKNGQLYKLPPTSKKVYVVYCNDPSKFELLKEYNFMPYSKNYSYFFDVR